MGCPHVVTVDLFNLFHIGPPTPALGPLPTACSPGSTGMFKFVYFGTPTCRHVQTCSFGNPTDHLTEWSYSDFSIDLESRPPTTRWKEEDDSLNLWIFLSTLLKRDYINVKPSNVITEKTEVTILLKSVGICTRWNIAIIPIGDGDLRK